MTNHKDLPAAELHEAKQIKTATAAQAGQVITPSSVDNEGELRNLALDEITMNGKRFAATGWANYVDSTYTSGSPLAISSATRTKLTINGAGVGSTSSYRADGDPEYWNTSTNKIESDVIGNCFDVRLLFTAETSGSGVEYVDVELDIGGGIGVICQEIKTIRKGTSTPNHILCSWPVYTLDTFVTNGGEVYLTPSANIDVYDIEIFITKTHQQG